MHTYRMLTEEAEITAHLLPVLERNGSEIPVMGCYVAAVEFDEDGEVVSYQMLQNALFLEGMWARDHSAHLLGVIRMAMKFGEEKFGAKQLLTFTRQDETGDRIARIAERLGLKAMNWNVFRRKI